MIKMASAGSVLLLTVGTLAVPAWAAPPPNDNRADAISVQPPVEVTGTLVDATLEPTNDGGACSPTEASVWYRFEVPKRGAVIIQVDAAGEMDAGVTLYRQVRSQLEYTACEDTDSQGLATIDLDGLQAGDTYAIRVGRRVGSVADKFALRVLVPSPKPEPPGRPLPAKGVRNQVDRLANPADAYWASMRKGVTMRLSLRTSQCTELAVYAPGINGFGATPLKTLRCGGYSLFTPTQSGRHVLLVSAGRTRAVQPYRLDVATAGRDDTTPGVFIGNNASVSGRVNGGIDSRDLYRFDVTRRSSLLLRVKGGPSMKLVSNDGRRMSSGNVIDRYVRPGRYYVAVEGSGRYNLRRVSQIITKAQLNFNGRRESTVRPGESVTLGMRVTPAVAGPGLIVVERFDPIDGWQFARRFRVQVSGGSARVSYEPPSVGRYRLSGEFRGTKTADSALARGASLRVQGPLAE